MTTKIFTSNDIGLLRISAIARKHNCSTSYVRQVLLGDRERKSVLSHKIIKDATDMLCILLRETKVVL